MTPEINNGTFARWKFDPVLVEATEMSERHLRELGVKWTLGDNIYPGFSSPYMFHSFRRIGNEKGNGAIALAELCGACDRHGIKIDLFTEGERLRTYYETFGFVAFYSKPKGGAKGQTYYRMTRSLRG